MKNKIIKATSILALIAISVTGCKKDPQLQNPPDNPPPPPPPPQNKKWIVTTVAGEGTASFVNGLVSTATFHFPGDVASDNGGGTLFVTDLLNKVIRKISGEQVSTFAGSGDFGILNGTGLNAQFRNPFSIVRDASGNLYTSDENDARIRKITPDGVVTTYAGIEAPGYKDGNADEAQFQSGSSLTVDADGNLFVADTRNNSVRKVSTTGQVTTLAGSPGAGFNDGNGAVAKFNLPAGITADKDGNLYVADISNFRIRKITPAGNVTTLAGGTQGTNDGIADAAQFSFDVRDLVADQEGNLFLSEANRIRGITPEGVVSTIAGSTQGFVDGDATTAKFNFPSGLGIDAQGKIYVADLSNNRIRRLSFE